jgi:hypothetical protein
MSPPRAIDLVEELHRQVEVRHGRHVLQRPDLAHATLDADRLRIDVPDRLGVVLSECRPGTSGRCSGRGGGHQHQCCFHRALPAVSFNFSRGAAGSRTPGKQVLATRYGHRFVGCAHATARLFAASACNGETAEPGRLHHLKRKSHCACGRVLAYVGRLQQARDPDVGVALH